MTKGEITRRAFLPYVGLEPVCDANKPQSLSHIASVSPDQNGHLPSLRASARIMGVAKIFRWVGCGVRGGTY